LLWQVEAMHPQQLKLMLMLMMVIAVLLLAP
jgi:hypothetical protein